MILTRVHVVCYNKEPVKESCETEICYWRAPCEEHDHIQYCQKVLTHQVAVLLFAACRRKGLDAELPHLLAVTPRSTKSRVQTDAIIKTIAYWKFGFSPTPPISLIYIISQSLNNTAVSDFGLFVRLSLPYLQHTQIPSSHVKFCVYYYSSYGQIVCSHWRSSISRLVCQWHIFLEFLKKLSYSISTYRDTLDIA